MKKILFLSMATATLLTAQSVKAEGQLVHSPYIGLGAGWVSSRPDVEVNDGTNVEKFSVQEQSPAGELFLGWMFRYNNFHTALELGWLLGSNNGKSSSTAVADTSVKSTYGINGALRLGYFFMKDVLVYVRAGFEHRNFDVKADVGTAANNIDTNYRAVAFAPGLGFEFEFAPNFMLGAEFRTAFFQSQQKLKGTTKMNVKPRTDTYLVRLSYKFKNLMN